jgi:hypothetical protein
MKSMKNSIKKQLSLGLAVLFLAVAGAVTFGLNSTDVTVATLETGEPSPPTSAPGAVPALEPRMDPAILGVWENEDDQFLYVYEFREDHSFEWEALFVENGARALLLKGNYSAADGRIDLYNLISIGENWGSGNREILTMEGVAYVVEDQDAVDFNIAPYRREAVRPASAPRVAPPDALPGPAGEALAVPPTAEIDRDLLGGWRIKKVGSQLTYIQDIFYAPDGTYTATLETDNALSGNYFSLVTGRWAAKDGKVYWTQRAVSKVALVGREAYTLEDTPDGTEALPDIALFYTTGGGELGGDPVFAFYYMHEPDEPPTENSTKFSAEDFH